jgi:hypothetical protein
MNLLMRENISKEYKVLSSVPSKKEKAKFILEQATTAQRGVEV